MTENAASSDVGNKPKALKVAEVADRLDAQTRTIHRWIQDGEFPHAYQIRPMKGSSWRIPVSDVEAYEARRALGRS